MAAFSILTNVYLPEITSKGIRLVNRVKIGIFEDLGKNVITIKNKLMDDRSSTDDTIISIKEAISNKESYDNYKIKHETINTFITDKEYKEFPNVEQLSCLNKYKDLRDQLDILKNYMPFSEYLEPFWEQYKSTNIMFFNLIKQDNKFRNSNKEKKFIEDSNKFMYIDRLKILFNIQDTEFWKEKDKEIKNKAKKLEYDYVYYNEIFKDNSSGGFFNALQQEIIKMRDEDLQDKIDKIEEESNDNNPFIVYA